MAGKSGVNFPVIMLLFCFQRRSRNFRKYAKSRFNEMEDRNSVEITDTGFDFFSHRDDS